MEKTPAGHLTYQTARPPCGDKVQEALSIWLSDAGALPTPGCSPVQCWLHEPDPAGLHHHSTRLLLTYTSFDAGVVGNAHFSGLW